MYCLKYVPHFVFIATLELKVLNQNKISYKPVNVMRFYFTRFDKHNLIVLKACHEKTIKPAQHQPLLIGTLP